MKPRFAFIGLWLILAPLVGCQQHAGDDWYCITLPNLVIPDVLGTDVWISVEGKYFYGELSTGHLPLHDSDIREIRKAIENHEWCEFGYSPSVLEGMEVEFDHWSPGKVFVRLGWTWDDKPHVPYIVWHTAHGWKVARCG